VAPVITAGVEKKSTIGKRKVPKVPFGGTCDHSGVEKKSTIGKRKVPKVPFDDTCDHSWR